MDDTTFLAHAMIFADTHRQVMEQNRLLQSYYSSTNVHSYSKQFEPHPPRMAVIEHEPRNFHSPDKTTFEEWEAVDKEHHLLSFVHVKVIDDKSVLITALWNEDYISKTDFMQRIEKQILIALALGYNVQALPTDYPTKNLFEEMGFSDPEESVDTNNTGDKNDAKSK